MNAYHPFGGAVYIYGSAPQLVNCRFINNTAASQSGGAVEIDESHTTIADCVFMGNSAHVGGAIKAYNTDLQISGCVFIDNAADEGGALFLFDAHRIELSRCTFFGNAADQGAAVHVSDASPYAEPYDLATSIVHGNGPGEGMFWDGVGILTLADCDLHGNAGGDWVGPIAGLLGVDGNFSLDPLFCDAAAGDLTLWDTSPCLPENSPGGVLVGALGQGCTTIAAPLPTSGRFVLRSFPNPCNPRTTVRFFLERPQQVCVEIHAVDGSRVVCLADRVFAAGSQDLAWDGRNTAGVGVASGSYLVRLTAADGVATEKVTVIR